jgi:signal transduction histidine kinase
MNIPDFPFTTTDWARVAGERVRRVRPGVDLETIDGHAGRLGQVFLNLLVNAIQATEAGRAEENEIAVELGLDAARNVEVRIFDTGTGIPPEVLPRIFDPFFTTKAPGIGTGLGLSICHSIVSSLQGRIEVASEPGKGSSFRVTLPVPAELSERVA